MTITIQPTGKITNIDGVTCRVWEGTTDRGAKCTLFIHRVAAAADGDTEEFDRELKEQLPPGRYLPLSLIL